MKKMLIPHIGNVNNMHISSCQKRIVLSENEQFFRRAKKRVYVYHSIQVKSDIVSLLGVGYKYFSWKTKFLKFLIIIAALPWLVLRTIRFYD